MNVINMLLNAGVKTPQEVVIRKGSHMSLRAWLVRRQIRKAFRPKEHRNSTGEMLGKHFITVLGGMEKLLPAPPKDIQVTAVDENGVRGEWVSAPGAKDDRVFFFSHGGGYAWGSPKAYRELAYRLSAACKAEVFLLDYSLSPEAKCPVALNEGLAAYDYVLAERPNASITMGGDSAGGGLTLSLAHAIRDSDRKKPVALAMIAPWTDLTGSGDSITENALKDAMLDPRGISYAAEQFCGDLAVDDPRCSPHFGDQSNLPPMLLQASRDEILRDDAVRLADMVNKAGGSAKLDLWPKVHHVWHFSARIIPEGKRAIADIGKFFEPYWV